MKIGTLVKIDVDKIGIVISNKQGLESCKNLNCAPETCTHHKWEIPIYLLSKTFRGCKFYEGSRLEKII